MNFRSIHIRQKIPDAPHLILNITTTKDVLEVDSIEENKKMKSKLQSKDNADNAQIENICTNVLSLCINLYMKSSGMQS